MTALTTYGIFSASSTLSTASKMVITSGGTSAGQNTTCGTATGYSEIFPQGTASAWAAAGSIGSPSGNGYLWDATTLETQTIASGTWTPTLRARNTGNNTITVDMYCRAYKYHSGTYTAIGTCTLAAQSLSQTTSSNYNLSGSLGSMAFTTGDKLY